MPSQHSPLPPSCMFNYHLWLCHWYIAPDLLEGAKWMRISEYMFNLLFLTLSLIYHTPMLYLPVFPQQISLWVYAQLSSLTLSLIYHIWFCPKPYQPFVAYGIWGFKQKPQLPSSALWVNVQWLSLTLSLFSLRESLHSHSLCLREQIFNDHPWLCHWYISPDAQSPTNPDSHEVIGPKPNLPWRSGSLWANVQLSSLTLSLITWCCSKKCS